MLDRQVKCENWIRDDDDNQSELSKSSWWLNRLITGRTKKMSIDWPYPFSENKLFVLTLSAEFEGYHINVDGRHVTSFLYRTGFSLEDAAGLSLNGNIDVDSVFAASLPATHPNFAPQRHLDMSNRWKPPPLLDQPVDLFIGILSAGNYFAENKVNVELKKEVEFFGDIVIVPYMDHYDLVVLKIVAICEYACDDDPL
ncbi:hypothetical protein P3S67_029628 [Capsicum chacoense]